MYLFIFNFIKIYATVLRSSCWQVLRMRAKINLMQEKKKKKKTTQRDKRMKNTENYNWQLHQLRRTRSAENNINTSTFANILVIPLQIMFLTSGIINSVITTDKFNLNFFFAAPIKMGRKPLWCCWPGRLRICERVIYLPWFAGREPGDLNAR